MLAAIDPAISLDSRVRLRPLTKQLENGVVIIGHGDQFLELPTEGLDFLAWLDQGLTLAELAIHAQVAPLAERDMAQYRSAFGREKFGTVEEMIADIDDRHRSAERKMRIIHPPGPALTLRYE